MDVRLGEVDQQMPLPLGVGQPIAGPLDERQPTLRVGPTEQLLGLLPRQFQAMQGGADRLAAAGPTEGLAHPADQASQGPTWRRIGPGQGRRRGGALGGADDRTEASLDACAKGGRPPVRR